jgi:hypothetical protein
MVTTVSGHKGGSLVTVQASKCRFTFCAHATKANITEGNSCYKIAPRMAHRVRGGCRTWGVVPQISEKEVNASMVTRLARGQGQDVTTKLGLNKF